MAVRSGRLDRRIEIHSRTVEQDDSGQEIRTYTLRAYAWAAVMMLSGTEKAAYKREESAVSNAKIEIRFDKDLATTDRIKFNGNFYDIQSIDPRGRRNRETVQIVVQQIDQNKVVNG